MGCGDLAAAAILQGEEGQHRAQGRQISAVQPELPTAGLDQAKEGPARDRSENRPRGSGARFLRPGTWCRGCNWVHAISDGKRIPVTKNGVASDSALGYR